MRQPETIRNKAIVVLRKADPKVFSFGHLSDLFGVEKSMIHKVFYRDKDKYTLPNETIVNKGV
jgi:hypothetical protein